jgi:hypothetical protein
LSAYKEKWSAATALLIKKVGRIDTMAKQLHFNNLPHTFGGYIFAALGNRDTRTSAHSCSTLETIFKTIAILAQSRSNSHSGSHPAASEFPATTHRGL